MVDAPVRRKAAEAMRQFGSGRISWNTCCDRLTAEEWASADEGFQATFELGAFIPYDPLPEGGLQDYCLRGRYAPDQEERRKLARLIVFWRSNLEYEWPPRSHQGCGSFVLGILSLARRFRKWDAEWQAQGDFDVWPFLRRSDYEEALKHPRLLCGRG